MRSAWRTALVGVAALAVGGTGMALAGGGKTAAPEQARGGQVAGKSYIVKAKEADDGDPITAKCPGGTHVIGGGAGADNGNADVNESTPVDLSDGDAITDDGWRAYFNDLGGVGSVRVYAICD